MLEPALQGYAYVYPYICLYIHMCLYVIHPRRRLPPIFETTSPTHPVPLCACPAVEKMSGTYVAAVALPITTATGEALFEFVDWSIYDQRSGQLVGKGSEGAYSGLVTRDVEVVALYNPIEAQVGDMPQPTVSRTR